MSPTESKISAERIQLLVRIYHTAHYAAEATGHSSSALTRRARELGLEFRQTSFSNPQRNNDYAFPHRA